jgi:hypothetical protein
VFCIIYNDANIALRSKGQRSKFEDDGGVWDSVNSHTTSFPYVRTEDGQLKRLFLREKQYCSERVVRGKRMYVALHPQPSESEVICVTRFYTHQKDFAAYRKRVSWVVDTPVSARHVAVVENVGARAPLTRHGNSKVDVEYVRTPSATMANIRKAVSKMGSSKAAYGEVVGDMKACDAPRDERVVRNATYNDRLKARRLDGRSHSATFADEVQQICSMATHDNYVQSVALSHDRVPCVTLYTDRQIADIRAFCNGDAGSVLSFDETYNLGRFYVTVSVYRNMALQRRGRDVVPAFIGPMFVHGNSNFDTFCVFLGHLSTRLAGLPFAGLRLGSDEEASLRKAMKHCFTGCRRVVCTRHLKGNLIRNAHKVQQRVFCNYTNIL